MNCYVTLLSVLPESGVLLSVFLSSVVWCQRRLIRPLLYGTLRWEPDWRSWKVTRHLSTVVTSRDADHNSYAVAAMTAPCG